MTTSPNPNHAEDALRLVNATCPSEDTDILALAQVHATLALEAQTARLADEARTANLLTVVQFAYRLGPDESLTGDLSDVIDTALASALARLDLTQDVTP